MEIRPAVGDMLHAARRTDGQVDMTKLIVTFRNFANALKNSVSASQSMRPVIIMKINAVILLRDIIRVEREIYVKYCMRNTL
jgi:hypothetical protein